jgi:integrase
MAERKKTKFVGVYQRERSDRQWGGKPDVCYDINYRVGGRLRWESVGCKSEGYTAQLASHVRSERLRQIRHGDMLPHGPTAVTMDTAWRTYLRDHLAGKPSEQVDTCRYDKHIGPVLGQRALHDVSAHDLAKLTSKWLTVMAPQTAKHNLSQIRRIMRKALEWGLWKGPLPNFEMPEVDNERFRFLTRPEADALLEELGNRSTKLRMLSEVALYTGMRAGELFRLRGYHLDTHEGLIQVLDGKKGKPRKVYMTPRVKAIFKQLNPAPKNFVFPDENGNQAKEVSDSFGRAVDALGFNDGVEDDRARVVFHTLRHTYASWLAIAGVPLYTIGKLLGHSSDKTTRRYAHLCPDSTRAAAMKIETIAGHES